MLQVSEARERLLSHFSTVNSEFVNFTDALGRVLAENIFAETDSPGFTHSAMDGVAVKAADIESAGKETPTSLRIIGKISAGDQFVGELSSGEGMLIMTGSMVPLGATAVVKVEDTNLDFAQEKIPLEGQVFRPALAGENIRIKGENYKKGALILSAGELIIPQDVGMLAMLGKEFVKVFRRPRVGIFSSGDELVEPGSPLTEGQIWNSNSHMLSALVRNCGGEAIDLGIIADSEIEILGALNQLVEKEVDLIISSGGVSMGMYDFVRKVIETHGELNFWKVNMRPGKPLAFGVFRDIRFVGLPGNPVSSFVGYSVFICPAVKLMAGLRDSTEIVSSAVLEMDIISDGRESYLPAQCIIKGNQQRVRLSGNQSSGNLYGLVRSNCLIKIPAGVQSIRRDSIVDIYKKFRSDINMSNEGE